MVLTPIDVTGIWAPIGTITVFLTPIVMIGVAFRLGPKVVGMFRRAAR